jgi:hypothetical protein
MTTDLVQRLRAREGGGDDEEVLMREAADEIELLRERVAELQAQCGYTESIQTVEIERLRALLRDRPRDDGTHVHRLDEQEGD